MDSPACHVIYVNRSVGPERLVRANTTELSAPARQDDCTRDELQPLLEAFGDVHVCASGIACLDKLLQLHNLSMINMVPTIILLDTPYRDFVREDRRSASRSLSPTSERRSCAEIRAPDEDLYGLNLLRKLITEAHLRNIAKMIVPIPIISHRAEEQQASGAGAETTDGAHERPSGLTGLAANRPFIRKCLELGATDVIIGPLSSKCIATLEISAYRAHHNLAKEQQALLEIKRGRQRSWVGVNEEKPFAYLREAMVSGLMKGICRLGPDDEQLSSAHVAVSTDRQAEIADAVGQWHFSAHLYTDDELVVAAMMMFKHTLSMPDLEKWRMPTDQLVSFLVACRAAYNSFVPYHNFRHVVDVLQATFNFLVRIGSIAPYRGSPEESATGPEGKSPMGSLISPFEALTLLVTAIGHDVGHPGVNNGFLVTLNAPLAQLYNDRSVLESFHCAAYSQILRRYWPAAFEDTKMRNLMISSILATDMGLHFDYMKRLGDTQEKLQANNSVDGWNGRQLEEQRALACSLLIKCADISNVARRHDAALQWMHILSEEFSRQASMEGELQISSSLMAPPKKDIESLVKAQLNFMNLFAIPLFQGVADIMPAMRYTVEELEINKGRFERMVEEEKAKTPMDDPARRRLLKEGTFSPRTMSFAVGMEDNGKEPTSQSDDNQRRLTEGISEVLAETPPALVDGEDRGEEALDPPPSHPMRKPVHIPQSQGEHKEVNGNISTFDTVRQLANSDPFNAPGQGNAGRTEDNPLMQGRQRCSETTEGSTSACLTGDWASQATSATGKMPMSPSTKGTSIVSKDSAERPTSAPGPGAYDGTRELTQFPTPTGLKPGHDRDYEGSSSTGGHSLGKAEGKALRKKPSRFRIREFPSFFRRHKGSSPHCQTAEGAS